MNGNIYTLLIKKGNYQVCLKYTDIFISKFKESSSYIFESHQILPYLKLYCPGMTFLLGKSTQLQKAANLFKKPLHTPTPTHPRHAFFTIHKWNILYGRKNVLKNIERIYRVTRKKGASPKVV